MDDSELIIYEPFVQCKEEDVRVNQNSSGKYLKVLNNKQWRMVGGKRPKPDYRASNMK
jgi:hypothetical protein